MTDSEYAARVDRLRSEIAQVYGRRVAMEMAIPSKASMEWSDLDDEFRAMFGEGIPTFRYPPGEARSIEVVRKMIEEKSTRLMDEAEAEDARAGRIL